MLGVATAAVDARPRRVCSITDILTRAVHAWHGSVFSHAEAVVACLPEFPPGSTLLALTADGGQLLELLTERDPTLVPLDADAVFRDDPDAPRPDVVLLADVLHHVAREDREAYLARIRERAAPEATFVVKEFAPGGVRSRVGWLTDRARSGEAVRFLTPPELRRLGASAFPGLAAIWTPLFDVEPPNYCILFRKLRLDRLAAGLCF